MPTPIQPKPTYYQGITFRSRLEARWAVLLDFTPNVIGWDYEPVEVKLANGWTYTPDFLIRRYHVGDRWRNYIEVKPADISKDYREVLKEASTKLDAPLWLIEGELWRDTILTCRVLWRGKVKPLEPDRALARFKEAYDSACAYRFDLKGG